MQNLLGLSLRQLHRSTGPNWLAMGASNPLQRKKLATATAAGACTATATLRIGEVPMLCWPFDLFQDVRKMVD